MRIDFDKVGSTPKSFAVDAEGVRFCGTLKKSGYHRVALDGELGGSVELDCDRCGVSYDYLLDTKLILTLSDTISEDKDDLDIIEFLNGEIDLLYILKSEIASIESSYHYCDGCVNSDDDIEIEF